MIVSSSTANPLGQRPFEFITNRFGMNGLGDYRSTAPPPVAAPSGPSPVLLLAVAAAAYFFFFKGKM